MSDIWGPLNQTLTRMRQPKEWTGTLAKIADMLAQKKEAERQRTFTATENEKTRTYEDTPFADGPRSYTDPVTNETFTYSTPREYDALLQGLQGAQSILQTQVAGKEARTTQAAGAEQQSALQAQADAARAALQSQIDSATMARLDKQIQADKDAAEQVWKQRSAEYDTPQSYFSTRTGKTYTWSTQEEYGLAQAEMENDAYIEAQKVIAALNGKDPSVASKIWEAYQNAKNEIFNPTIMGSNPDEWLRMQDFSQGGDLEERFVALINGQGITDPADVETALNMFRGWLQDAQSGAEGRPGEPAQGGWYIRPSNTPTQQLAEDVRKNTEAAVGQGGLAGWAGIMSQTGPQLIVGGNNQNKYPTGVSGQVEQDFYDRLMSIFKAREQKGQSTQDVDAQIQRLLTEDVKADDMQMMGFIQDMLSKVQRQGL